MTTNLKLLFTLFIIGVIISFSNGCSNFEDESTLSNQNSLFLSRASEEGTCVLDCMVYCGNRLGIKITDEEIENVFGRAVIKDANGHIVGIMLNSEGWMKGWRTWFSVRYPKSQNDLIHVVSKGLLAPCLMLDRHHAIVLTGIQDDCFKCYDPAGSFNTIPFSEIFIL